MFMFSFSKQQKLKSWSYNHNDNGSSVTSCRFLNGSNFILASSTNSDLRILENDICFDQKFRKKVTLSALSSNIMNLDFCAANNQLVASLFDGSILSMNISGQDDIEGLGYHQELFSQKLKERDQLESQRKRNSRDIVH